MSSEAMSSEPTIVIRPVEAEAVVDLRHRVLLPNHARDYAIFEGDAEPTTIHIAALDAWDVMIGCATLLHRPWQGKAAWQLRGMAIDHPHQGRGIGGLLLAEVDRIVLADDHSRLLWCNARSPAVKFYEMHGWRLASPEFEIPTAGPHHKMTKHL